MVFATTRRPSSDLWFPVHILPLVPWVHTEGPQISQPAAPCPVAMLVEAVLGSGFQG